MGSYKYKADASLTSAWLRAAVVPVCGYGVLFYRRRGFDFYSCIPEKLRPYALLFVGLCSLVMMCAILYFACKASHVVGDIDLDEQMLRFEARRTRRARTERVEIEWRSVTVIGNDERGLSVLTPRGEFHFKSKGFSSTAVYGRFRREFSEKRYKNDFINR